MLQQSFAALDGTKAKPSFTFVDAPGTGLYRDPDTGKVLLAIDGEAIGEVGALVGDGQAAGDFTVGNDLAVGNDLDVTGAATIGTTLETGGDLTVGGDLVVVATAISEAEIGVLNAVTPGSVAASKACVVDSNKDLGAGANAIRHLKITGNLVTGSTTLSEAELGVLDAVTPGTAGANKALVLGAASEIATITTMTVTTLNLTTLAMAGALKLKRATVAALGVDNTDAAPLATGFTSVTGADDAKGVKLPTGAAGEIVIVKNTVANKILKVYPGTGVQINALTATTGSLDMAAGTCAVFIYDSSTQVYTAPLLPS